MKTDYLALKVAAVSFIVSMAASIIVLTVPRLEGVAWVALAGMVLGDVLVIAFPAISTWRRK